MAPPEVRAVTTRAELAAIVGRGEGFLYNDVGGTRPADHPVHAAGCRQVRRMLAVPDGPLGVRKLWSASLGALLQAVGAEGKPWALCRLEPALAEAARVAGEPRTAADARRPSPAPRPSPERRAADAPRAARAPEPPPETDDEDESPRFLVRADPPQAVSVWSARRLPFDERPSTRALRHAIGEAVEQLTAPPGHVLSATFTSPDEDPVDAENVLFSNVGTARFAAAARHGARFERVVGPAPAAPAPVPGGARHHHRYAFVAAGAPFAAWEEGPPLLAWNDVALPPLDASSKPDAVWRAVRTALLHEEAPPLTGPFALRLALAACEPPAVRPADVLKPLVDGVVAALHVHDGRDLPSLLPRIAARLGEREDVLRDLLTSPGGAVLGRRRLLWPRATGFQWNPADDACVACELLWRRTPRPGAWRLSGALHAARARLGHAPPP
uniref:Uncharacterized protein n=1 Tax=Eiseniibacteriota bacterium TaxID=2212470 RepID=A0A832MIG5_UNCEI